MWRVWTNKRPEMGWRPSRYDMSSNSRRKLHTLNSLNYQTHRGTQVIIIRTPILSKSIDTCRPPAPKPGVKNFQVSCYEEKQTYQRFGSPQRVDNRERNIVDRPIIIILNFANFVCDFFLISRHPFWDNDNVIMIMSWARQSCEISKAVACKSGLTLPCLIMRGTFELSENHFTFWFARIARHSESNLRTVTNSRHVELVSLSAGVHAPW